jgi:DNA/RNA endonuclease G (NUC1)
MFRLVVFLFLISICGGCDWTIEAPNVPNTSIICHSKLMIVYDESVRFPVMTYGIYTQEEMLELQGGRKEFVRDPSINSNEQHSPEGDPAFASPMSRGHLTPSDIMSYDKSRGGGWEQSYYITNVLPQNLRFNEGSWAHFERKITDTLAGENGTIWEIYTGGYWNGTRESAPDYFWKAFCRRDRCSSGVILASNEEEPEWRVSSVNELGLGIYEGCCPETYQKEWNVLRQIEGKENIREKVKW